MRDQLKLGLKGEVRTETLPEEIVTFGRGFIFYCLRRFGNLLRLLWTSLAFVFGLSLGSKFYLQGKLYRRKGQLSFPLVHASLLGVSFSLLIFTSGFGEFLFKRTSVLALGDEVAVLEDQPSVATEESKLIETEVKTYVVQEGDTLYDIAYRFRISVVTLVHANDITDPDAIRPGSRLQIPPVSGLVYKVKAGDTIASIAEEYKADPQDIIDFNYLFPPLKLAVGNKLIVPFAQVPQPTPVYTASSTSGYLPSSSGSCSSASFSWPVTSRVINRGWMGSYHPAWDLQASYETVRAVGSGKVVRVSWQSWGYGLYVDVDHGGGWITRYAHLSRFVAGLGKQVSRGQAIAVSGRTGWATGPHLHLEVRCNGKPVVPSMVLQ
jgi:murein DD-endopeptidase MepM/ murein hydrolase activator NlpD